MSERFCSDIGGTCIIGSALIFLATLVMIVSTLYADINTLSLIQTIEFGVKTIFGIVMTIIFLVAGIKLKR